MTATNLKIFIESNPDWTQTRVANSLGISVSALNAFIQGSYKGDNGKIERAIIRFLESQKEVMAESTKFKKDFDFVETSVYSDVLRSLNLAAYRGELRVITGQSGIGKTFALEHIKEERESSMVLVRVYPGMRKTRFMKKLCQAAGLDTAGTFDDLFEDFTNRLTGSGRVIAIDEVEHLTIESIDAVRRINDFTGCGVVLVGLPKFYNELASRQNDYAYVYNRTAMPMKLSKNKGSDLTAMASTFSVIDLPDKLLLNVSQGIGRDLRIILLESMRVAAENGINTTDVMAFSAIIEKVKSNLGRKVA